MKETLERENLKEPEGWIEVELHKIDQEHELARNEAIRKYRDKFGPQDNPVILNHKESEA